MEGTIGGGYAKVASSQVCRPKEEGDPSIRNVMALNKALMSRHLMATYHSGPDVYMGEMGHHCPP
ncbi:UNVERIFIED_CONTAM: hypothetical protein Sradi_7117500 [Sesamum radiatum]|uniref:Uncharacterized protein n=1 Tax=Sesamum radiatum TaxID=300843 RepID=A0AAW2J076_SESRA